MEQIIKNKSTNREVAWTARQISLRIVEAANLPTLTNLNLARLWTAALPRPNQRKYRVLPFLISIWIIITDRFYEDQKISTNNLHLFQNEIGKLLNGQLYKNETLARHKPFSASLDIFREIYSLISKNNPDQRFLHQWAGAITDFLGAMAAERYFSKEHPPTFSQYIENGKKSIGSSAIFHLLVLLMFRGAGSLSSREFDIIKKGIDRLSVVMRIANDIGSFKREQQNNLFNGLDLLIARGYSIDAAQNIFRRRIKRDISALHNYKKTAPRKIKTFFAAADRLLKHTFRFYEKNDYHS